MRSPQETLEWLRMQRDDVDSKVKKYSAMQLFHMAARNAAARSTLQETIDFITERIDDNEHTDDQSRLLHKPGPQDRSLEGSKAAV